MKSLLALAVAVTSTQVYAGSLNLDFRLDSTSTSYNDATKAAGLNLVDNHRFNVQTGRLDYKGTLSDETTYRFRARFNRSQAAVSARDNLNNTIDYAFVSQKLNENVRLTVGKLPSDIGGNEGNAPGADLYLTSEATSGAILGGSVEGYGPLQYITGVKLGYTMDTHNLNVMAANTDYALGRQSASTDVLTPAGNNLAQTRMLTGVSYLGSFMDKAFTVIASYHMQNPVKDAASGIDTKSSFTGVGLGYTLDAWNFQADYLLNDYQAPVATVEVKDKMASTIGKVTYTFAPTMSLQAKVTSSEETIGSTTLGGADTKNKYMGIGAAFEYKAKAEDNFRYHVAYVDRTMKPAVGDDRKITEVIVGTRINADFLK